MVVYYKNFALSGAIVLSSFISIIGVIFAHIIMDIFTKDTFYLTATSLIGFYCFNWYVTQETQHLNNRFCKTTCSSRE